MLNVCRHRGTRLVFERAGIASTFTCVLHAWTYDLCGRFGTIPISRCAPLERRDDSALVALACEVRHGFVWVVPSPAARTVPLAEWLDAVDAELARYDLEDRTVASRETTYAAWSDLAAALAAHRDVTWLFPASALYADGEAIVHLAAHPQGEDDIEIVTTRLVHPS
jgi:phenylpropionate dioxygenase-like ring-hydroxylating dioxygenase large terminal subunit